MSKKKQKLDKQILEAEVESALVAYANATGCLCLKLKIEGRRGFPDRMIVTPSGVHGYAELKRPVGGQLSRHQDAWADYLKGRKCNYDTPRTAEAARDFIDLLLELSK